MSNKNRQQQTQAPAPAPTDAPSEVIKDNAAAGAGDATEQTQGAGEGTGQEQQTQGGEQTGAEGAGDAAAQDGADKAAEGDAGEKAAEPELLGETNVSLTAFGAAPTEPALELAANNPVAEAAAAAAELPHLAQTFEEKMVAKHANGARTTQALITYLNMYVEAMHPKKPENQATFAQQQASLWNAIYTTLENEEAFDANFTILLEYFAEHGHKNGVFHAYNNFRGMENVPLNKDQRTAFEYVCYLLHTAANSKQWNQMQINVPKALSEQIFSEGARNRVMNFLRIG